MLLHLLCYLEASRTLEASEKKKRRGAEGRGEAGGKPEELGMGLDGGAEPQASRARLASPSLSFLAFDQLGIHSGYI